jgi:hypothetical protein
MPRFVALVSYESDVILTDEHDDTLTKALAEFGARKISVVLSKYIGAGDHEFVKSQTPGLQEREICVKCLKSKAKAASSCPGIQE